MNEDIFDSNEDTFNETKERPDFLTVLIILTWIAVAGSVLSSAYSIANSGSAAEQMELSMVAFDEFPDDNEFVNSYIEDTKEFSKAAVNQLVPINLTNLIFYLIEGFAALLMFNLKKIGFWVYILCQFGFLSVYFIFYPSDNIMTTIMLSIGIITSSIFSILYGVNAKYLKN